jgi:hypothetical protein
LGLAGRLELCRPPTRASRRAKGAFEQFHIQAGLVFQRTERAAIA